MIGTFAVPVEGGLIHGEMRGPGTGSVPAFAFLHGMAGSGADWDRVWAQLPADTTMIRHDLRAFGRSSAQPGVPFSHADDLGAVLDARHTGPVTLVGVSMGGAVALNFALSHPHRVQRLVLVSPALVGWEWSDDWKALWRAIAGAGRQGDLATARALWWQHPMFAQVRDSDAGPELRAAIEAYHGRQWSADDQRPELPDIDRLPTLAMPVLLLTGEHDVADMRLIASVITGSAPQVTRIDFPGAGHMLHLERPREVADATVAFTS